MSHEAKRKVVIVGWDCASPRLVLDDFRQSMPNVNALARAGCGGPLRSVLPPITVPAWMCAMTGKTPDELGVHGFRRRDGRSYRRMRLTNADDFAGVETLWDDLAEAGYRSLLVGVPPSYPVRPAPGIRVGCFLTPDDQAQFAYPREVEKEIKDLVGQYMFDVSFRSPDRDRILNEILEMTHRRHKVVMHLMATKEWDFLMVVEIGLDRIHHTFWKYFDATHPLHEEGSKYARVIPEYYALLDRNLGEMLAVVPKDALVVVMSDHGVKGMKAAFCMNEWLIERGHLKLAGPRPASPKPLDKVDVDWPATKAWAWGGYCGRVFVNVRGREARGAVAKEESGAFAQQLAAEIREVRGPGGERLATQVIEPRGQGGAHHGERADLLVIMDDLAVRIAGTVGHKGLWLSENDTGPDDAVHDWNGLFVARGIRTASGEPVTELTQVRQAVLDSVLGQAQPAPAPRVRGGRRPQGGDGHVVWLTGLPASGKTTVANKLRGLLVERGRPCQVLDGDEIRRGLSADLGFSRQDREEHARRVMYVADLLAKNGVTAVVCLISPYRSTRALARRTCRNFVEVYVKASLEECKRRDPKGLYAKAARGELPDLTGVGHPYEEPEAPDVVVDTEVVAAGEAARRIAKFVEAGRAKLRAEAP